MREFMSYSGNAKDSSSVMYDAVSLGGTSGSFKVFLDCLILKVKAVQPFEASGYTCPITQRRIPEDLSLVLLDMFLHLLHLCMSDAIVHEIFLIFIVKLQQAVLRTCGAYFIVA
jgi:hypothetical protein